MFLALFPFLAIVSFAMFLKSVLRRRELTPLLWNIAIVLFSFLGLSFGLWPYMIPSSGEAITFHNAAGSSQTLIFMLIVMVIITPVILVYHNYQYWVFRGEIAQGEMIRNLSSGPGSFPSIHSGHISSLPFIGENGINNFRPCRIGPRTSKSIQYYWQLTNYRHRAYRKHIDRKTFLIYDYT